MGCPRANECDFVESTTALANDVQGSANALEAQLEQIRLARETIRSDASDRAPSPVLNAVLMTETAQFPLENGMIIGRRAGLARELFANDLSISRQHLRFDYDEGRWFLENLSLSGSPVLLAHQPVGIKERRELIQGTHLLELGDTFSAHIQIR